MTFRERTVIRAAIDTTKRAWLEEEGGFGTVERDAREFDTSLYTDEVAELQRRLDRAYEKLHRARKARDRYKAQAAPGWWHEPARRLHEEEGLLTFAEIARVFGVSPSAVAYALDPERRRKVDERKRSRISSQSTTRISSTA